MNLHNAILQLNPTVVTIRGDDAFDANDQPVNYDKAAAEALVSNQMYKQLRAAEYPNFLDYLDGIVKGDQTQMKAYVDACLAVKAKYPKPESK